MSPLPSHARVVIVGAGIAGNALAWHLARLGWRDIVQVDKGPLPNPGGSTGHASSFTFPVEYNRQMVEWCMDALGQFEDLGVLTRCGGIEVARTPERMHELKRRLAAAHAFGVDAELLDPAGVTKLVPWMDGSKILGGFHVPAVGVVDPVYGGTLMRDRAMELGALTVSAGTEVTGVDVKDGRITGVRTTKGDVSAEMVVVCGGVWSAKVAAMAGARIPLTPAVHQMVDIGPVPAFEHLTSALAYPVIRDMDALMYERQSGGDLEIGSYAHRAILVPVEDIPSNEEAALSPTELPFTPEDFDDHLPKALELYPSIVGDESVGIKHAINGLISLTADGFSLLGEMPEVKGLVACSAMWIKEAPSLTRMLAEWLTDGQPEMDPAVVNIARFSDHHKTHRHVCARGSEWFPKFYGIVHPGEQWATDRGVRLGAAHAGHVALGAEFIEIAGWERPNWYESNRPLLAEFGARVMDRPHEWDRRWWSPIINAEHLALRDRVGLIENPAFAIFDITGTGALDYVQRMAVGQVDVAPPAVAPDADAAGQSQVVPGRVVYTQLLNEAGGIKADVTILRLGHDHFRIVDAGFAGPADRKWLEDHLPADGSVALADLTSAWTMIAIWGPRARDVVSSLTTDDVSNEGFPYATWRWLNLESLHVMAARISYAGELGWELHVPMEQGQRLWDLLFEAGRPHGIVPVGLGAYGTTLRLEKGYRLMSRELELDRNLVEAGLARPKVKDADFIGKAAYLAQREAGPAQVLCTLTVDENRSPSTGELRYMLGGEPIVTPSGELLVDVRGRRSFVTTAGSGPSVGKHLLMAYLPPAAAVTGMKLAVEYIGELYPVTVAGVGATALFDPANERLRG
ncbi:MAG TPA: FAD-dependent oxidoreductase [Candidatus Limnocylindrales bacterium]|nr:FAD-dependent oxidoreductase [Candidatus Limnocylindrales bacterium]